MHDSPQTWFRRGAEPLSEAASETARLAEARQRLADLSARSPDFGKHACTPGCTACCHYRVGMTAVEVRDLAVALQAHPEARELSRRVRARAAADRDEKARERSPRPCALLDSQGRCSLYEHRPLACAGWTSLDREACDAELAGRGGVPRPDAVRFHAARGLGAALEASAPGDARGPFELHAALADALDGRLP